MDISATTEPKSDQQQFDAYLGGVTRTVTISDVTKGSPEQPVNVELSEYPGHPFRPNKSMRRVLVLGWGKESSAYIGRKLKLFGNPAVVFGGKAVGGVEIEAMSHLDKPLVVPLTVTRGKRKNFPVQPLAAEAPKAAPTPPATMDPTILTEWLELFATTDTLAALQLAWVDAGKSGVASHPQIVAAKDKKKAELTAVTE